jgi:hypothetical protein
MMGVKMVDKKIVGEKEQSLLKMAWLWGLVRVRQFFIKY